MSPHTHRRTPPNPKPTPRPSRVSTPVATPGPLDTFADALTKFQKSFLGELTLPQRRLASKIPAPKAAETLGMIGDHKVAGLASTVPPGKLTAAIVGVGTTLGVLPGRRTRISATASNPEAAVRHEATHHLLTAQGVPRGAQHTIIGRARVPGTTRGVSPRLLEGVRLAETVGTEELRRKSSGQIQQAAFGQRRREAKTGTEPRQRPRSLNLPAPGQLRKLLRPASARQEPNLRTLLGMNL